MDYIFTLHSVKQLYARGITRVEVISIVETGEVIKEYPDDEPYPTVLILGFVGERPLPVVVANNVSERIIVTAYEPEKSVWAENYKRRIS